MRIENIEAEWKDETMYPPRQRIWVRQSWLNDVMICPERSRLGMNLPEWRQGSDATHIGTAVHRGIEHYLTTGENKNSYKEASLELERLMDEEPFKLNSTNGPDHMREYVTSLVGTFHSEIAPHVVIGGKVEANFGVPLLTYQPVDKSLDFECQPDPIEVWLGGTMDYVDPNGVIWDWKTAGRKYSQGEKQRQSIQASAYAYASVHMGWSPNFPVRFNYGVMTRATKSVGQIVPIIRTESHVDWFKHQVHSIVQPLFTIYDKDKDMSWPVNDQHGLCSEKWCPYWSICKGSQLSDFENNNTNINEESING